MLIDYKNENLILFIVFFIIFSSVWIFLLGFGSPIAIMSGFLFGQWAGTIISVFSFSVGSSLLYLVSKYYFSDLIIKYLSKKIEKFKYLFNKNELLYFFTFRLSGGAGIPFPLQNVLPVIFNMKLKNYIYATFFGLMPTVFIVNSLGAGIEGLIGKNDELSYRNILMDPDIYFPIIGFLLILCFSFFIKNKIFKK